MIAGPTPQLRPITSAPRNESFREQFGVVPNIVLPSVMMVICAMIGDRIVHGPLQSLAVFRRRRKSLQTKQIYAAFEQRDGLRLEHLSGFVERGWTIRLDAEAEWTNRSGNVSAIAGGFAATLAAIALIS